ncbi:hypothetical protein AGLY_010985 [Aphis glycines]|uniref:Uncharacterized protein n=1 Tax=Aphis glycines TaxID=307491 RepID=A0A6G0TC53_APHGL|nr:hypothetical protein AGLY_010985 [Aphis glycines]
MQNIDSCVVILIVPVAVFENPVTNGASATLMSARCDTADVNLLADSSALCFQQPSTRQRRGWLLANTRNPTMSSNFSPNNKVGGVLLQQVLRAADQTVDGHGGLDELKPFLIVHRQQVVMELQAYVLVVTIGVSNTNHAHGPVGLGEHVPHDHVRFGGVCLFDAHDPSVRQVGPEHQLQLFQNVHIGHSVSGYRRRSKRCPSTGSLSFEIFPLSANKNAWTTNCLLSRYMIKTTTTQLLHDKRLKITLSVRRHKLSLGPLLYTNSHRVAFIAIVIVRFTKTREYYVSMSTLELRVADLLSLIIIIHVYKDIGFD